MGLNAFSQVQEYALMAVGYVQRSFGLDHETASDVVQDVLITIHGARATYDPSRSFVAWLTAILILATSAVGCLAVTRHLLER